MPKAKQSRGNAWTDAMDCHLCVSGFQSEVSLRSHLIDHTLSVLSEFEPSDEHQLAYGGTQIQWEMDNLESDVENDDDLKHDSDMDVDYKPTRQIRSPGNLRQHLKRRRVKPSWLRSQEFVANEMDKGGEPKNGQQLESLLCVLCDWPFHNTAALNKHMHIAHGQVAAKLQIPTETPSKRHHTKKRGRRKTMCLVEDNSSSKLQLKVFLCSVCKANFIDEQACIDHVNLHTVDEIKGETDKSETTKPDRSQTTKQRLELYQCGVCKATFGSIEKCRVHVKNHSEVTGNVHQTFPTRRVFRCAVCSIQFDDKEVCIAHMKTTHMEAASEDKPDEMKTNPDSENEEILPKKKKTLRALFRCSLCLRTFRDRRACLEHTLIHSSSGLRPAKVGVSYEDPKMPAKVFGCSRCEEVFSKRSECVQHLMTHYTKKELEEVGKSGLPSLEPVNLGPVEGQGNVQPETMEEEREQENEVGLFEEPEGEIGPTDEEPEGEIGMVKEEEGQEDSPSEDPQSDQFALLRKILVGDPCAELVKNSSIVVHQCISCKKKFREISLYEKHIEICKFNQNTELPISTPVPSTKMPLLSKILQSEPQVKVFKPQPQNSLGLLRNILINEKTDKIHLKELTAKYECPVCKMLIVSVIGTGTNALEDHIALHPKCPICNDLVANMPQHVFGQHKCPVCQEGMQTIEDLQEHMETHQKCDVCGQLQYREDFKKHREAHPNCSICEVGFVLRTDLVTHVTDIHKVEYIECDLCQKNQSSQLSLAKHMKSHPKCPKCEDTVKMLTTFGDLAKHMVAEHEMQPKECWVCLQKFTSSPNFLKHVAAHRGHWPPKCVECNKEFKNELRLTIHMYKHTQDYPYRCEVCGTGTWAKSKLDRHMRVHTNDRSFTCDECGKSYKDKETLATHLKTHASKIHQCDHCEKSFNIKGYLIRHQVTHMTPEERFGKKQVYTCEICLDAFLSKMAWKKHMISTHGVQDPKMPHMKDR